MWELWLRRILFSPLVKNWKASKTWEEIQIEEGCSSSVQPGLTLQRTTGLSHTEARLRRTDTGEAAGSVSSNRTTVHVSVLCFLFLSLFLHLAYIVCKIFVHRGLWSYCWSWIINWFISISTMFFVYFDFYYTNCLYIYYHVRVFVFKFF